VVAIKRFFGAVVFSGFGIATGPVLAADMPVKATVQAADQVWNVSYNTELRFFSWNNTRGYPVDPAPLSGNGHGTQVYAPMSFSVSGSPTPDWRYEFVIRGGAVSSSQTTAGNRGSVDTLVDTQVSNTVTYNGFSGFQPFAAMLINLPTGSAALFGNSRYARMDGDLVDQGTYGEGWNWGPTAGVNIPLSQSLILTLSGGYTVRTQFNKEALDPITNTVTAVDVIKNGDEGTVTAALGYSEGPLSLQGSGSYSWDQASGTNGLDQYRVGPRTTISGSANYTFDPMWSVYANGFWTHTEKNDVQNAFGTALISESFDSNSNLFRINSGLNYRFANGFTVGPVASYLFRDHNGYDATTFSFVPAKTRWSVGAAANYNVTNKINVNFKLEHVWIHEDEFTGPPAFAPVVPFMNGDAWVGLAGATVNF
jgi:hypothetical protein